MSKRLASSFGGAALATSLLVALAGSLTDMVETANAQAPSAAAPKGLLLFFTTPTCPDGWTELEDAKGRLIVAVSDATLGGVTVNAPLADREDRTHSHPFATIVDVPSKNLAAINCCDDQGAQSGQYLLENITQDATTKLPFVQLVLCRLDEHAASNAMSFASVAFFDPSFSQCPVNWRPFDTAAGRLMVPSAPNAGSVVNNEVPALSSGEDRTIHSHNFSVSFVPSQVTYAGVDGCCDNNPTADTAIFVAGTTEAASTGLPYVQLLTCVSNEPSFNVSLPRGALFFNEVGCPPGWHNARDLTGTLMVALPQNGSAYAFFGGEALSPDRHANGPSHDHEIDVTVSLPPAGVGLASGCCASGYAAAGAYPAVGRSEKEGQAGTEYPMSFVNLCVQD